MVTVADTAYAIAVLRAREREHPASERLFDDPYAAIFAGAGAHVAEATQRLLDLPFLAEVVRLRTRFIDDAVREGLDAGLTQVVLMGAGFDARALRMPEIAARGAKVFEVDFAEQLETKRAILAAAGIAGPAHVAFAPCDFRAPDFENTLVAALGSVDFREGAGAMFVWEGVTGYIDRAKSERTLRFMARLGGPGSRVTFDYGHSSFDPETAAQCAQRVGYSRLEEHACDELWRRWLPGEPHENAWFVKMALAVV